MFICPKAIFMIETKTYEMQSVAHFLYAREKFGGFGNPSSGYPIIVNGTKIDSTETYYQAMRFPHLPEFQAEIIATGKGIPAKRKAYERINESRSDWDEVKVSIMRHALRLKLMWNRPKMLALFDASGEMPIVEHSFRDTFWGTMVDDHGRLVGKNVLGRLLMELRTEVRVNHSAYLLAVPALEISQPLLLGSPVVTTLWEGQTKKQDHPDLFNQSS